MKKVLALLLVLALAFTLVACKGDKPAENAGEREGSNESVKTEDNKDDDAEKTISKTKKTLKHVKGAAFGSMSTYVEDKEIWKDFVDEKYLDYVSKEGPGMHLPKILLDSADAKDANEEIDGIEKYLRDLYEKHKSEMDDEDPGVYADFSVYQDESILSLMIETYNYWEGECPVYRVFNFSLPDGKYITDFDLMKHFGVEKDEMLASIENSLKEKQDTDTKIYYPDIHDSRFLDTPSNYTGIVLNKLWDDFASSNRRIYIDEVGKPYFILNQSGYASPLAPITLELKLNKFDTELISSEYIRMARKLGIDPKDEKYKAFVIYLGSAYNEESLKSTFLKVVAWRNMFSNYEDPRLLLSLEYGYGEGSKSPYLNGQECYLVVPKYKNASIILKALELSEGGELKEVENGYMDNCACAGPTLVCQNISEIAPNAKIIIRYRDELLEFSPSISQKDGSVILPDEVYNAEDVLDWDKLIMKDVYPVNIFDILKSMMLKG